jgi:hypothetical protein
MSDVSSSLPNETFDRKRKSRGMSEALESEKNHSMSRRVSATFTKSSVKRKLNPQIHASKAEVFLSQEFELERATPAKKRRHGRRSGNLTGLPSSDRPMQKRQPRIVAHENRTEAAQISWAPRAHTANQTASAMPIRMDRS